MKNAAIATLLLIAANWLSGCGDEVRFRESRKMALTTNNESRGENTLAGLAGSSDSPGHSSTKQNSSNLTITIAGTEDHITAVTQVAQNHEFIISPSRQNEDDDVVTGNTDNDEKHRRTDFDAKKDDSERGDDKKEDDSDDDQAPGGDDDDDDDEDGDDD